MAKQLQKLPDETQNILKLAACIGNQFDLNTLAMLTLPVMTSPQSQALLRMLAQISGATYLASPALYPLIIYCAQFDRQSPNP